MCSVTQQLLGGADAHNVWQLFANITVVNNMVQQDKERMKEGRRTMDCLEEWLSTYLRSDSDDKVYWSDGEKLSLALYNLDQDWFSNLR